MSSCGFKGRGHGPQLLWQEHKKICSHVLRPPHHSYFHVQRSEFLQIFSRESHLEKSLQVYLHQKPTSINQF